MSCQHLEEQMPAYLDGDMPEPQRLEFTRHLDDCHSCRLELEKLEKSWAMLDCWEPVEPSALLRAQVWEKIRQQPVPQSRWKALLSGLRLGVLSSVATACLVLGLTWTAAVPSERDSDFDTQVPSSQARSVRSAEDLAADLPLGQIELFGDSDDDDSTGVDDALNVGHLSHHLLDQGTHDALRATLEEHE